MEFSELMARLDIKNPPASWERNHDASAAAVNASPMPTAEDLEEYRTLFQMEDGQLEQLTQCRRYVTADPLLNRLWHIWYAVLFISQDCHGEQWSQWPLPGESNGFFPDMFRSLVLIANARRMLEAFAARGLPEQFVSDGTGSFAHLSKEQYKLTSRYGITNTQLWWLWPYMLGHTFRLGRLIYEISKFPKRFQVFMNVSGSIATLCAGGDIRYDETGRQDPVGIYHPHFQESPSRFTGYGYDTAGYFVAEKVALDKQDWKRILSEGDDVLFLHIPSEGKLTNEAVRGSFDQAGIFFDRYFADIRFKALICSTWLFNTELDRFLPPGSNILAFQKNFTLILGGEDTHCIYDFIFRTRECPLDQLRPTNAFQEKILSYALGGGILRNGFGFRLWNGWAGGSA